MAYAIENARYQWDEGERRIRDAGMGETARLERAILAVQDEIRRRLGGSFSISELAELYGEGTDWAYAVAQRRFADLDSSAVVDAAFGRYARESNDFAGGKKQLPPDEREQIKY